MILSVFLLPVFIIGQTFISFDDIPATAYTENLPESSTDWKYYTGEKDCGWKNSRGYSNNPEIVDLFYKYSPPYNTPNLGYENFGFLDIDDKVKIKGHSLRYIVTGGVNPITQQTGVPNGDPNVYCKQRFLQSSNPVDGGINVGAPYIYFTNTSRRDNPVPFESSKNKNRLSFYLRLPKSANNGNGGNRPPEQTFVMGPFSHIKRSEVYPNGDPNAEVTGHWYQRGYNQGGNWIHVLMDEHPQHSNTMSSATKYPYPSKSMRNMKSYLDLMYRFYLVCHPYTGVDEPVYSIWVDEMEFQNDTEPQNEETINVPAIGYNAETKTFDVSFNDKYVASDARATYEIRYSFSQITNANWNSAKPVHIQEDARFKTEASTAGILPKYKAGYYAVWGQFKLATQSDQNRLTPGRRVFFAIKDVSQIGGNSPNPIGPKSGRNYAALGHIFDYEADKKVLNLIKRIDYLIVDESQYPLDTPTSEQNGPRSSGSSTSGGSNTSNDSNETEQNTEPQNSPPSETGDVVIPQQDLQQEAIDRDFALALKSVLDNDARSEFESTVKSFSVQKELGLATIRANFFSSSLRRSSNLTLQMVYQNQKWGFTTESKKLVYDTFRDLYYYTPFKVQKDFEFELQRELNRNKRKDVLYTSFISDYFVKKEINLSTLKIRLRDPYRVHYYKEKNAKTFTTRSLYNTSLINVELQLKGNKWVASAENMQEIRNTLKFGTDYSAYDFKRISSVFTEEVRRIVGKKFKTAIMKAGIDRNMQITAFRLKMVRKYTADNGEIKKKRIFKNFKMELSADNKTWTMSVKQKQELAKIVEDNS